MDGRMNEATSRGEFLRRAAVGVAVLAVPGFRLPQSEGATMSRQFGMYNNCAVTGAEADTAANWKAVRDKHMVPAVHWRREFNSGLPAAYNGGDVPLGIGTFLSFKSPYTDVVSGASKAKIQAYVKTWPQGCYATWEHEPENVRKEFVSDPYNHFVLPFQKVYEWVKAVRPDVQFGPVHLCYQWGPGGKAYAARTQWEVAASHADFYGTDWYNFGFNAATWNLATATDFQNWFRTFAPKGKPIVLSEFGVASATSSDGGKTDTQTAAIIKASADFVHAHPQIVMALYWNGINSDGGTHDIQLTPSVSDQVGRPKALAAWNALVAAA